MSDIFFIAQGVLVTLKYSLAAVFFGSFLGIFLAVGSISNSYFVKSLISCYVSIFRGTPLMIQLSIIYFAIPQLFALKITASLAVIIAFSLNSAAYTSETIRSGIKSIDIGQFEAAKALSVPYFLMMKDIILPQAARRIIPALMNELANLIKETAIIAMIGEMDLMRRAQMIAMQKYDYFTPMITAACCYYLLILIISVLAKFLERRLAI